MRHSQYRQFLLVPRKKSKPPPPRRYIACNQWRRFPTNGWNQFPINGGDAITITLPFNVSIHQQEPYTKLETISKSTWLHQTNQQADKTLSRLHSPELREQHWHPGWCLYGKDDIQSVVLGVPDVVHIQMRSSLPTMSAYESDESSLLEERNKLHSMRRMKPTYRAESLHNAKCTTVEVRLQTHYSNAAPSTSQMRLPRSRTYKWEPFHTAKCIYGWDLHFPRSTGTVKTTKRRYGKRYEMKDRRWNIWDELHARGSKAIIQNSRTCRTTTMVRTPCLGRPRSVFRNPCTGKGYDMHTIWYSATTIMRGEPGDIVIVKAIIVIANPRGSHDIVNTHLGQPDGKAVSSVMLPAAKLVICFPAKRMVWLSLYE